MRAEVLAICINYWNEEDTIHYVNDLLLQQEEVKLAIIVVDNNEFSGENPLLKEIESASDNVEVYRSGRNAGYYGAASWALKKYLMISRMPEWIIVSNSDIRFEKPFFLSTLLEVHNRNAPEVVAPRIISDLSGLDQNPFMRKRPPVWKMHSYRLIFRFSTTFYSYRLLRNAKSKMLMKRKANQSVDCNEGTPFPIYAPHGSIIAFNKKYFEKGGTLDYGAFLFDEEIFIAETARRLDLTIMYEPRMIALHKEHATTKMTKDMLRFKYESSKHCAVSYFAWGN